MRAVKKLKLIHVKLIRGALEVTFGFYSLDISARDL
jgi:hypothetical protein